MRRHLPQRARPYILDCVLLQLQGAPVKAQRLAWVVGLFIALCIPSLSFAQSVSCESRDYQRNYCAIGGQVTKAWLINQTSSTRCIQGRTWGYDGGGIWVNSGCAGEFGFQGGRGRAEGGRSEANNVRCESRNYERNFCEVRAQISRAWLVQQESEARCIEGQTWGARGNGIWVNQGCAGVFAFSGR
jgi:Protein of unknown function (DUF3011)